MWKIINGYFFIEPQTTTHTKKIKIEPTTDIFIKKTNRKIPQIVTLKAPDTKAQEPTHKTQN